MGTELLRLSTLVERETILIESALNPAGRLYELRNPDELSAIEYQTILTRQKQAAKASEKGAEKLSPAEARRLTEALDELVRMLLPELEQEVLAELNDSQKAAVTSVWARAAEAGGGGGEEDPPRAGPTGAGSPRGSSGSTAARRAPGSKSRSGSSRRT